MLLTSVSGAKDYVPKAGDILVKLDRLPISCIFCPLVSMGDPRDYEGLIACRATRKQNIPPCPDSRDVDCPLMRVGF